jgi:benzil reductase ((S)-benzoin forming)
MDKVLIISGGSKGIGRSLVNVYQQQGYRVFTFSRTIISEFSSASVQQFAVDLLETAQIAPLFEKIFSEIEGSSLTKITLINNAGSLGEMGTVETIDSHTFEQTLTLNALVPMLCSQYFVQHTKSVSAQKTIINITSGAAQKPYFGWSAYCSSKAALNMFTQAMAVEQADQEAFAVRTLAIAPGVVDTDMQEQIRAQNEANFKDIARFIALKEEGKLADADAVAQKIYEADCDAQLISGSIIRIA